MENITKRISLEKVTLDKIRKSLEKSSENKNL